MQTHTFLCNCSTVDQQMWTGSMCLYRIDVILFICRKTQGIRKDNTMSVFTFPCLVLSNFCSSAIHQSMSILMWYAFSVCCMVGGYFWNGAKMLIKLFLQKYLYTCGLSLKSHLVLLVRNWKLHLQDVQHPHVTQVLQAAEHQKLVQYVIIKLHCKNLQQMNKIKTNGLKCVSLPSCKSDVYELYYVADWLVSHFRFFTI